MIIDEPKHYQKHATTRNPYIVLFGFVTVAGILGFPMGLKGEFKGDANDISSNGIWACEGLSSNVPAGNGILIHFETGRTTFKSLQLLAESTMNTLYLRIHRNGSWKDWKSISLV